MVTLIDDDQFSNATKTGLVLVDFFAEWCGPCRMLTPIMEELQNDLGAQIVILKMDIDKNPLTAEQFEVTSIPTLILFYNGEVAKKVVGLKDKDFLTAMISQYL
ncbi:thioredoxin [Candidatus Clavichlamydia salmonicola]|uniref:thioredoxin n=1 Tax=Candidatus Clavichlamydia salmonicola TaxID=469812 RepID=UPI00189184B7|nr:thioredoxin [Candidatus Clavichlamydia salmonicola]